MSGTTAIAVRARCVRILVTLTLVLAVATAAAQTVNVVRVEQDWELVIDTPDPACNAPQITCVISPTGNIESFYGALEMNVQTLGCYAPGGMQLQLWDGSAPVADRNSYSRGILATPGEVVTWTQSMEIASGALKFEITNGTSVSWGEFGRLGLFHVSTPTTLTNLNGYDSQVSVSASGVGFADNRVQSLTIKKVRYYTSTGEVIEDTQPKVIHSLN